MLDVGWTELLVIAIVLIVVVGPKDLPPMIRAFGRTMANLRKVTGEFRTQFDQALKEADMDDVRKTIGDVQSLNPSSALRDAINPLRQMGQEIRSDLEKSVSIAATSDAAASATATAAPASEVKVPEPQMKLPDSPPVVAPVVLDGAAGAEPVVSTAAPAPKRVAKAAKSKVEGEATKPKAKKPSASSSEKPAEKKVAVKKAPAKKKVEKEV